MIALSYNSDVVHNGNLDHNDLVDLILWCWPYGRVDLTGRFNTMTLLVDHSDDHTDYYGYISTLMTILTIIIMLT